MVVGDNEENKYQNKARKRAKKKNDGPQQEKD